MRVRLAVAILWTWAIWSVGAAAEYLTGANFGAPALLLGIAAAFAVGIRWPALRQPRSASVR
jgi:hypothetical protein